MAAAAVGAIYRNVTDLTQQFRRNSYMDKSVTPSVGHNVANRCGIAADCAV